jgi:hypothetical protein
MSILYNYIHYFIYGDQYINEKNKDELRKEDDSSFILIQPENKSYLISINDLKSVNLTPVKNIIPGPARNMPPFDKVNLKMLNKAQLNQVLSVKLKPVIKNKKPDYYAPRHPVLKELHSKFKIIN